MATIMDLRPNGAQVANVTITSADLKFGGEGPSKQLANAMLDISPNLEHKANGVDLSVMFMAKNQLASKEVSNFQPIVPSTNITANTKSTDNGMTV